MGMGPNPLALLFISISQVPRRNSPPGEVGVGRTTLDRDGAGDGK